MLHYKITAHIDPVQQTLQADVYVSFPAGWDKLKFCLHKDLVLEKVEGQNIDGFLFSDSGVPFSPEARGIELTTTGPVDCVHFLYHGKLGITSNWEVNRISPNWTELGLYTPWFPLSVPMQEASFSVQLHLPPGYSVVSSGSTVAADGCWLIHQSVPALDLTIAIARDYQIEQAALDGAIVVASFIEAKAKPVAAAFARIGAEVLAWFNSRLGSSQTSPIDIVIAPRSKGGGYARRGFIVFSADVSLEDEVVLYRYIAHEFAHLWWYRANTSNWEDWLNESLAEISSLLAVRDILGRETYARLLAVRREKGENLPPIRGIDRESEEAHAVLYCKGCVILAELEASLGEENFLAFLQELVRQQITSTAEFLEILRQFAGKLGADAFALQLET